MILIGEYPHSCGGYRLQENFEMFRHKDGVAAQARIPGSLLFVKPIRFFMNFGADDRNILR